MVNTSSEKGFRRRFAFWGMGGLMDGGWVLSGSQTRRKPLAAVFRRPCV
ncbi:MULTISPECIES: hypothetical protein [unclassified Neisseria]